MKKKKILSNITFISDFFEEEIASYLVVDGIKYIDYIITTFGNLYHAHDTKNGKIKYVKIKPILNANGYYQNRVNLNGTIKNIGIHRMVAMTFLTNFYNKEEVNHLDSDRINNKYKNLEWSHTRENLSHAIKYGKRKVSEENSYEDLYPVRVLYKICEELELHSKDKNFSCVNLANELGVSKYLVSDLFMKRRHNEITSQFNFESSKRNKYDDEILHLICKDIQNGESNKDISTKYGVKPSLVSDLKNNKKHADIVNEYDFSDIEKRMTKKEANKIYSDYINTNDKKYIQNKYNISIKKLDDIIYRRSHHFN